MEVEVNSRWQLQEAKQRFSELIRSVEAEGPQVVTRHGEDGLPAGGSMPGSPDVA